MDDTVLNFVVEFRHEIPINLSDQDHARHRGFVLDLHCRGPRERMCVCARAREIFKQRNYCN